MSELNQKFIINLSFFAIEVKMWLQTFCVTLASVQTAMLSWLLPVIIFEGNFFSETGASCKQVNISLDSSWAAHSSA